MKRIDIYKERLSSKIQNAYIGNFENLIYQLMNCEAFNDESVHIMNMFDEEHFQNVSDKEMNEIIKNGEYSIKFIEWLNEEI